MPRKARIDAPGAIHHIIVRGIERKRIFQDNVDRNNFLARLGDIIDETCTSCFAWALIPNHVHLLLRTGERSIATVMRRLLTGYAVTYNRRHRRHGHLFQNRYKSILCQEDPYFLQLVRYIHLNPLRAKIIRGLDELESYAFCGHSTILGKNKNDWQDVQYVLSSFGRRTGFARHKYREYVRQGFNAEQRSDFLEGDLIRTMNGWTQVTIGPAAEKRLKCDERILGDSGFVENVLKASEEELDRKCRLKTMDYDLDKLAGRISEIFDIEPHRIYFPNKYPRVVQARSVFCYWAIRELDQTATSLAKKLNLTQPSVSISSKRGEKIVRELGLNLDI